MAKSKNKNFIIEYYDPEIAKTETIKVSAINEFNARYVFNRFHPKAKIISVERSVYGSR